MIFCGQCGSQLAPGATRCPRCGAVTDASTSDVVVDAFHGDDPTVESHPYAQQPQASPSPEAPYTARPHTPGEQPPLVLHSDNRGYDYGTQGANEPTSIMKASDYRAAQAEPLDYHTGASNQGYPNDGKYPAYSAPDYQSAGNYAPQQNEYASFVPPGGAAYQLGSYQPVQQPRRRGRVVPLLVVLFGLIVLLGGLAVFAQHHTNLLGGTAGSSGSNGSTTTNATPTDQAKAVVQQYYTDVNNKDYQSAYDLWKWGTSGPTLERFERGYANTVRDDLTINDATQLNDGTVKVSMTIVATEKVGKKTRPRTYSGYYILGQDSGTWKIFRGYLG